MKTITETLQLATSQLHNKRTTAVSRNLSARQKTEAEKFLATFPSIEKVYNYFCPARWEHALKHEYECLTAPCISLAQLDELYHTPGAAQSIIRGMLIGLYSLTTAREEYNAQAANLASGMFVSKFGNYCSMYDVMLYFGGYILTYKNSYGQFDIVDVLQQFSRKYLPWKQSKLQINSEDTQETPGCGGLFNAIVLWMMKGDSDEDIKKTAFYQMGRITDKMIEDARAEYRKRIDGEVF